MSDGVSQVWVAGPEHAEIAARMLAAFNGDWNGSVDPVFEAYQY